jgi:RNA-directed DNA polymerase
MAGDTRYFYRRYMDDFIVLAKTRWHLRKALRRVNQHFNQLKIEQAPNKTFIGRIEKGFDFLGYRFGLSDLALAEKTITNAVNKVRQPTFIYREEAKANGPQKSRCA